MYTHSVKGLYIRCGSVPSAIISESNVPGRCGEYISAILLVSRVHCMRGSRKKRKGEKMRKKGRAQPFPRTNLRVFTYKRAATLSRQKILLSLSSLFSFSRAREKPAESYTSCAALYTSPCIATGDPGPWRSSR